MKKIVLFALMLFANVSHASVIMVGTRVIFSSSLTEKTVQFNNPDPQPYIVQIKLTGERENSSATLPFVAVPPVFRIEPHQGQSVRLISSKARLALPQDRESVFYMNFTQIPALKASEHNDNLLIIAVKSRIKVFYRPESLSGQQGDAFKLLRFSLSDGKVIVENPTGYYLSVSSARYVKGSQSTSLTDAIMLPPFSKTEWSPAGRVTSLRGGKILITQVNDYGAYVEDARDL